MNIKLRSKYYHKVQYIKLFTHYAIRTRVKRRDRKHGHDFHTMCHSKCLSKIKRATNVILNLKILCILQYTT